MTVFDVVRLAKDARKDGACRHATGNGGRDTGHEQRQGKHHAGTIAQQGLEQGLGSTPCELRLDRRYKGKALLLSVSGEDKTNDLLSDSYTEMLKGLDLSITTYYAAEKNICNIMIP